MAECPDELTLRARARRLEVEPEGMASVTHTRREFLLAASASTAAMSLPILGQSARSDPERVEGARDLATLTVSEAFDLIRRRQISIVELTEACLRRIDAYNPALNAVVTIAREEALQTARQLDTEHRRGGRRGPLHGIPVALKDNIDTAGIRTTGASALFKDRVPDEDAFVVSRLKAAGAIVLGKLNLHEFALGGTNAVTYFGPVHNPWAMDHHPGGSSGGNAAAVAADLCLATLGTDTGGSIRIPASYCGVVGLKPTAGRVSNRGVIPNSWTFDTVGPMCKTVEDAALMLGVIAGYDALDPVSVNAPVPDFTGALRARTSKLRVGIPRAPFFDNLEPDVSKAIEAALAVLRALVREVKEVQLPPSPGLGAVSNAEIYAFHAPWVTKTPELYQDATRRIVMGGATASAEAYAQGLRQVELARREIAKSFASIDAVVTPTTTGVATLIPQPGPPAAGTPTAAAPGRGGAPTGGGAPGFRNTSYFSYYGLPAVSVPCGFTASGLPIGLQISGAPFAESNVLALAHAYERATEWHKRKPPRPVPAKV
jgi:aspartyl-tRNA(Asn)/glutamyl-tRNA(Gln) amidotransferase subunit A